MAEDMPQMDELRSWRERFHTSLYDDVLPFWMKHSLDREFGGYFTCLDRDGSLYDTKKHVWLQGRQVWMLSRIHNILKETDGTDGRYLEAAELGARFIRKHAKADGNRVYFSLTREGRPVFIQRKMFAECFYVMGLAEYARASGDDSARQEALDVFESVQKFARNPALLGRPQLDGMPKTISLAVPMILLNLIQEVNGPGEDRYPELAEWCVEELLKHFHADRRIVLETVLPNGSYLDTPEGRLVNPGHAIEAGWFLLDYACRSGRDDLKQTAIEAMDWSFDFGWDKEYGGLYYYLDAGGYSPLQLEWSMKLWWPHCEALIGFLMAYRESGEARHLERFRQVAEYSFDRFPDPEFGEWYGYLDRRGEVAMRYKAAPYKGCFHLPRALLLGEQVLDELTQRQPAAGRSTAR